MIGFLTALMTVIGLLVFNACGQATDSSLHNSPDEGLPPQQDLAGVNDWQTFKKRFPASRYPNLYRRMGHTMAAARYVQVAAAGATHGDRAYCMSTADSGGFALQPCDAEPKATGLRQTVHQVLNMGDGHIMAVGSQAECKAGACGMAIESDRFTYNEHPATFDLDSRPVGLLQFRSGKIDECLTHRRGDKARFRACADQSADGSFYWISETVTGGLRFRQADDRGTCLAVAGESEGVQELHTVACADGQADQIFTMDRGGELVWSKGALANHYSRFRTTVIDAHPSAIRRMFQWLVGEKTFHEDTRLRYVPRFSMTRLNRRGQYLAYEGRDDPLHGYRVRPRLTRDKADTGTEFILAECQPEPLTLARSIVMRRPISMADMRCVPVRQWTTSYYSNWDYIKEAAEVVVVAGLTMVAFEAVLGAVVAELSAGTATAVTAVVGASSLLMGAQDLGNCFANRAKVHVRPQDLDACVNSAVMLGLGARSLAAGRGAAVANGRAGLSAEEQEISRLVEEGAAGNQWRPLVPPPAPEEEEAVGSMLMRTFKRLQDTGDEACSV